MKNEWHKKHREVIADFLQYLNQRSDEYVLKGGTSLMMCYDLDRFSEDIDLDCSHSKKIADIVKNFCENRGYLFRTAKDTDTTKRYMIDYGNAEKKLKVEVSYRRKNINHDEYTKINGITVYNLEEICIMKTYAYNARDKLRDLYDITFLGNHYWDELSDTAKHAIQHCLEYKGIEQFDYLVSQQSDELIDNNKLAADFLALYDKLGLFVDEEAAKPFQ